MRGYGLLLRNEGCDILGTLAASWLVSPSGTLRLALRPEVTPNSRFGSDSQNTVLHSVVLFMRRPMARATNRTRSFRGNRPRFVRTTPRVK